MRLNDIQLAEVERLVEARYAEQGQDDGEAVEPIAYSELVQQRRENLGLASD